MCAIAVEGVKSIRLLPPAWLISSNHFITTLLSAITMTRPGNNAERTVVDLLADLDATNQEDAHLLRVRPIA